jgi:phosphoribosylpyrophosphate synthetase
MPDSTVTPQVAKELFADAKHSKNPVRVTFKEGGIDAVRALAETLNANTVYCDRRDVVDVVAKRGSWGDVHDRSFTITVRPYADEEWLAERMWQGLEKVSA